MSNNRDLLSPQEIWETDKVESLFYVKGRIGWRGLRRADFIEHGPYLITGMHIADGRVRWEECFHIPEKKLLESPEIIVQSGDLVITKDGTIGKVAYIDQLPGPTSLNSHLFLVRSKSDKVMQRFAYYIFNSERFQKFIEDQKTGSTLGGLPEHRFLRFLFPTPDSDEQKRITAILDTVDEAIRQTEAFIAKLKQIKAGLLHDLLTCGVDENGELRNPVAHPDQFQRTSLGLFPKNWEITTLGNVITRSGGFIQTGPFGSQLHSHEYTSEGTPVIMPDDMIDGQIDPQEIRRIPVSKANILSRHKVKQNDVVFARRGDLSRCFAVTDRELDWLCGTGCLLVRVPEKEIVGYWLALLYGHDMIQRQVLARAVGSTMVNLNSKIIAGLAIGKPKTDEQKTIVKILDEQNAQIQTEKCYLSKLHQLKQGLMQDLLTGSVRVNEINFDLPEA